MQNDDSDIFYGLADETVMMLWIRTDDGVAVIFRSLNFGWIFDESVMVIIKKALAG